MNTLKNFNATDYKWKNSGTALNDWKEKVSYDANGNILSYIRHGNGSVIPMDSMTYTYNTAGNQLNHVDDGIAATNYSMDIDDQSANNYLYDKSGNLIKDVQEGLDIQWNAYGKITQVYDAGTKQTINFRYDASGNRMVKQVMPFKKPIINTYYIRDASGNILATYLFKHPIANIIGQPPKDTVWWEEQHLYGSGRVGIDRLEKVTFPSPALMSDTATLTYYSGCKNYELTNHLGNVLGVVNDKRIGVDNGSGGIGYYRAEVVSAGDYYPFGMVLPDRSFSLNNYNFGFQGSIKENEICGDGNIYTTDFRELDVRLGGRWWGVDPATDKYSDLSPYCFSENSPIRFSDPKGDDWFKGKNGAVLWRDSKDATYEYKYKNNKGKESAQIFTNIGEYYAEVIPQTKDIILYHQQNIIAWGESPVTFEGFSNSEYQSWDAYIGGFSSLYGADPNFVKSLIIQETGAFAGKNAWRNDPMQMFHPGDYAKTKNIGSISEVRARFKEMEQEKQFANGILSINSGIQWLYNQKGSMAQSSSNVPSWFKSAYLSYPLSFRMAFRYNGSYTQLETSCSGNYLERAFVYASRVHNRYIKGIKENVPTGTNYFNWDKDFWIK